MSEKSWHFWCDFYGNLIVSHRNPGDVIINKHLLGRLHVEIDQNHENYKKFSCF